MTDDIELEVPSWEQIYDMLLEIAERIRKNGFRPDVIVGVSRGGWPPARVLSDLLENPQLANVKVEFYTAVAETKEEPVITQPVSVPVKDKLVLVVDDVADTGKSLALVKNHLAKLGARDIRIATLYYKPWSIVTPDYYERETSKWIIFPWERKEAVMNLVEKYRKQGKTVQEVREKLVEAGLDEKLAEKFVREALEKIEGR